MTKGKCSLLRVLVCTGALLGLAGAAHAQPDAKTVPWVANNSLIPHDVFSGVQTTLKGTADLSAGTGPFTYSWDFGDATATPFANVVDQYNLEATHTYTGNVGDIFAATLTVVDNGTGLSDMANYFVEIRPVSLETEVNAAIDEGLWYLHKTMNRTTVGGIDKGDWLQSTSCGVRCASSTYYANTATNVNAFFVNGHVEGGSASNPYTETVQRAMKRVFELVTPIAIGSKTYPAPIGLVDPDTNGNGIGLEVNNTDPPYQGGQVIDAIVASGTPNALATTGAANVIGRTYAEIVQDMVDAYSWGQSYSGVYHGGWRYDWPNYSTSSDNSTNQWAAIGLIAAEREFGGTVPQFVKDANINSVNVTQNAAGWFGYTNTNASTAWGTFATTPSGLVQMAMDGIGRGDARWDGAENYMRDNFCNNTGSALTSVRDYYYGLFSFTKSMLLHDSDGDLNAEPIADLANQPGNLNPLDWYEAELTNGDACDGVARTLVADQRADGSWYGPSYTSTHYSFTTAWAIIMLNRTVFASGVPVAVASANPNPAVVGATIHLDGSSSFHQDPAKNIISWEWDLDNDGTYDTTGPTTTTSFAALGSYPVGLRVCDDAMPQECDTTTVVVQVTIPPIAPTADAGGPYNFCPAQSWFLDGTGSVNPDDGVSEPGFPGDSIISYQWELNNNGAFDDASGSQPDVTAFFSSLGVGSYLGVLKVTDNTAGSFPSSGSPNLSDNDSAQIFVRDATDPICACIADLTARPKSGKVQLVWGDTAPAGGYNVYRSTTQGGPYTFLGNTTSSYSTYLDSGLTNGTTYYYVVRPAALNGNEVCQSNEASGTPQDTRTRR